MKYFLVIILILPLSLMTFGQGEMEKGMIKGRIVTVDNSPIPFSSIRLMKFSDSSLVRGVFSDTLGSFQFEKVEFGRYYIEITNVQFDPVQFVVSLDLEKLVLEDVKCILNNTYLDRVEVIGKRDVIIYSDEGVILNVSGTPLANGRSALDILKFAPNVSTSGGVQILGSNSVKVIMDGKELNLSGKQLESFLSGLMSENVNSIEIIDKPGVGYDGETGGVIVINTINTQNGYSISGFGTYTQKTKPGAVAGLNLFLTKNKFRLFSQVYFANNPNFNTEQSEFFVQEEDYFLRRTASSSFSNQRVEQSLSASLDYQINPGSTLGVMYSNRKDNEENIKSHTESNIETSSIADSLAIIDVEREFYYTENSFNAYYKTTIDTLNSKIELVADYSIVDQLFPSLQEVNYSGADVYNSSGYISQDYTIATGIFSIKSNLTKYFRNGNRLTGGLKYSSSNPKKDFSSVNALSEDTLRQSFLFDFKQDIYAAYSSYKIKLDSFSIVAGVRAEYTTNYFSGNLNQTYLSLFPKLTFIRLFNKKHTGYLTLSKSISRPSFNRYNPFVSISSPNITSTGNPDILPVDIYKIGLTDVFKNKIYSSLYFKRYEHIITTLPVFDTATEITSYLPVNNASRNSIGFNSSIPFSLTKWWDVRASVYVGYQQTLIDEENETAQSFQGALGNATMVNMFSLPAGISMELYFNYSAPSISGYYNYKSVFVSSWELLIPLFNERATLGVIVDDIFNTNKEQMSYTLSTIRSIRTDKWDTRTLMVMFSFDLSGGNGESWNKRDSGIESEKNRANEK
ncbi:MAG: TonB-dependent receptor [Crocinitomix sp.]|nr:TonB-dependent receptor [Crocinitomix sp.]